MVAEVAAVAGMLYKKNVSVQHQLCVSQSAMEIEATAASVLSKSPTTGIFHASESFEIACSELGVNCSTGIQTTAFVDSTRNSKYLPSIRSGSHTDIGPRRANEDEHIRIDDLSTQLGSFCQWSLPSSFYAVFDGHGGSEAAAYVKNNAVNFFFKDADLPQKSVIDEAFLEELESSCRRSFLLADKALADECSVDDFCGTTAITALILGRHLLIANAGDCRAVLCRKGAAVQMSQDHRPSHPPEQKRIEDLGGSIKDGRLGDLTVTRALGDWYMKLPDGTASPLTAEPEVQHIMLTEDDEFLIIGCDGLWDVMSNEDAVSLVRRELRLHDDPQQCARELVRLALRQQDIDDNLTAIVVCFTTPVCRDSIPSQRPRLRFCSLSEEARRKLRSLLEIN